MTRDHELTEMKKYVNTALIFSGCSLKCIQWLSAYSELDAHLKNDIQPDLHKGECLAGDSTKIFS